MVEECRTIYPILSALVVPTGFLFPDKLESSDICIYILKILFYLFLDRGEGREKERERNIDV